MIIAESSKDAKSGYILTYFPVSMYTYVAIKSFFRFFKNRSARILLRIESYSLFVMSMKQW